MQNENNQTGALALTTGESPLNILLPVKKGEVDWELAARSLPDKMRSITLSDAITQPRQLSGLKRDFPKQIGVLIITMISELQSSVNLSGNAVKMSSEQTSKCASAIMEEFWMLRPEEVLYVFKQALTGKYGANFNRLDCMTMCGWIREYELNERLSFVRNQNKTLKEQSVKQTEDTVNLYERLALQASDPNFISPSKKKKIEESDEMKKTVEFARVQQEYYENKKNNPPAEPIF